MDSFFGSTLNDDECDRIALMRITPELRGTESHLFTTKWFDYRHLHPTIATYYFAHCYIKSVRDIHAVTKDYQEAKIIKVLDHEDIFIPPIDVVPLDVSFWKSRQAADSIGVPYDFALSFTMNRAASRGWHVYPRPNQLYASELTLDIQDAWKERMRGSFQTAKNPRFQLKNFIGHIDQVSYQNWLLAQVAIRDSPSATLSRCMRECQLNAELALSKFSSTVVNEALSYST